MRTAAVAPHLRVVAAPPRSLSGSALARPSTLPGAAALQTLAVGMAPGTRRRRTPERSPISGCAAEIRPASPRARARARAPAGWLCSRARPRCSRARPRRAGPRPALDPFPWQRRGLRRPTAAKPRCVTSRRHPGSCGSSRTPRRPGRPIPHFFTAFLLENSFPTIPTHNLSSRNPNLFQKRPLPVSPETTVLREIPAHFNESMCRASDL